MNNLMKEIGLTHKKFHCLVKTKCEAMGISSSFRGIIMILSRFGEMSQVELGEKLYLSKPTISLTLKNMEAQGLIQRSQSQEDARIMIVSLTDAGKEVDNKIKSVFDEVELNITNTLSIEEKEQLFMILDKIQKGIECV